MMIDHKNFEPDDVLELTIRQPGILGQIFSSSLLSASLIIANVGVAAFLISDDGARPELSERLEAQGAGLSFRVAAANIRGMNGDAGTAFASFDDNFETESQARQNLERYKLDALEMKMKWHGRPEDWALYQTYKAGYSIRVAINKTIDAAVTTLERVRPALPSHP